MKILNVVDVMNPLFGGAPERTYQMSRYLGMLGVEVDILTTSRNFDRNWVSNIKSGNVFVLKSIYLRYLFPLGAFNWFKKNINNYDAIHISQNWSILSIYTFYLAIKYKVPYVFSGMGFVSIHNRSKLIKRFFKLFFTKPMILNASYCIAVTKEEKVDLINFGVKSDKVKLIPNGIIVENFLIKNNQFFRNKYNLDNNKIMLFIGRMDRIKGVHLLIDAFYSLRENLDGWNLILVGTNTSYRSEMENKVKNLNLNERIIFLNPIFGDLKSMAYHAAEFIIIPSVKDAMTIIAPEAACCSKAVLITKTSDFSELAKYGGSIEVDPTVKGLAKGIQYMISDECNKSEMGHRGYEYVNYFLRWERIALYYHDIFKNISSKS